MATILGIVGLVLTLLWVLLPPNCTMPIPEFGKAIIAAGCGLAVYSLPFSPVVNYLVWDILLLILVAIQIHKPRVPKDEFDPSLDMDLGAMLKMNKAEQERYCIDLVRRRQAAHEADQD